MSLDKKTVADRYAKALAEAPFEFLDALKEFEELSLIHI